MQSTVCKGDVRRSKSRGRRIAPVLLLCLLAAAHWGCQSTLETGYVPRPLGTSSTERRGYYASPFTPEAAAAAQAAGDPTSDIRSNRKPGGGYRGP